MVVDEEVADAGGGGPGGIVEGLGEVDVVGVELVAALDDDRLEDPEFDVLGVESVDIAVAPVGDVDEVLVGGAVVAGGATTFPLLKLTAPKFEVKAADDVAAAPGVDVGEA